MHSRCNIACDYCYLYEGPDSTWRDRSVVMTRPTLELAASRIAEHGADRVHLVLHGGEPLLAGAAMLATAAATVRAAVPAAVPVDCRVQTNGTRLDRPSLDVLAAAGIKVGVSVDGDRAANDRHRLRRNGTSSFPAVSEALRLLRSTEYRASFAGILATIDLRNDPAATFAGLAAFEPPTLDFLLPHANWSSPPPGGDVRRYGDWLIGAFDAWYGVPDQPVRVRLFEEIIRLALGAASRTEFIGPDPAPVVVIETDGTIEQVDTLKSAYHGAAATGCSLRSHTFREVMRLPQIAARSELSDQCRACPILAVCGGGYYPHRFRAGAGFRNPTVYCTAMQRLIPYVVSRVQRDIALVTAR